MKYLQTKTLFSALLIPALVGLASCETTNGGNSALKKGALGAAAGAIAGSIIGNNAGDGDAQSGALIGAVIGGAGGAYAGCREDGGCGANQNSHTYGQNTNMPAPAQGQSINKRQFFDNKTGRYYFYDPVTQREYYENGEPKHK